MDQEDIARHFRNAASNYATILNPVLEAKLEAADEGLTFPDGSDDPLDYLGNLDPLNLSEEDKAYARALVREVIADKGRHVVWQYRIKHKLELHFILH